MTLHIIHNDITNMDTDVIVNAANCQLLTGGGVCGAIFKKAGIRQLTEECQKLAPIATGQAVITKGYQLKSKYIIHAVGPIYKDGLHHEKELLENAYLNSLKLAVEYQCQSISFPLISSGIYGYPKAKALDVAISTISSFLNEHDLDVYIVVFDKTSVQLSEQLYSDILHYIDTYYEPEKDSRRNIELSLMEEEPLFIKLRSPSSSVSRTLDDLIENIDESFSEMILRLIDEKGYKDVDVYKRANMDRKLFSKIRSQKDYHPSKKTVFALSIALRLNIDETIDLLNKAGYSLSHSQKSDIIIEYFIINNEYDIFKINEALFCFNQPTL